MRMYCIDVKDKGYYLGFSMGVRRFSSKPHIIDWFDDFESLEAVAEELSKEFGSASIKEIELSHVKTFVKKTTFSDVKIGGRFAYVKDRCNNLIDYSFVYVKTTYTQYICIKCPQDYNWLHSIFTCDLINEPVKVLN